MVATMVVVEGDGEVEPLILGSWLGLEFRLDITLYLTDRRRHKRGTVLTER